MVVLFWNHLSLSTTEHSSRLSIILDMWFVAERTWYTHFKLLVGSRDQFLADLMKGRHKKVYKLLAVFTGYDSNALIQDNIQLNADTFFTQADTIVLALIQDHHYVITIQPIKV